MMREHVLGIDHLGLTVSDLEATKAFFVEALGWDVVGGRPEYPSAFISNGSAVLTLWQQKGEDQHGFDRHANVGLHHVAFKIPSRESLDVVFAAVKDWPGVQVEFAPEPSGAGPKIHFMIQEPGGNRIEFAYDPR
ncbi:VOC family protein [Ruegeria lacuscaerulensis]|uniref:VOC family protein n=1 Tax=Ruegeria lacuscaerulensis TaxID=55218 RepID=UPI001BE40299|nr:VOC family protein [Ruegeria lacuscaerulensis]